MNRSGLLGRFGVGLVLLLVLLVALPAAYAGWQVRVPADSDWVATGITVTNSQALNFYTVGIAITGPLRDFPGARSGPDGQSFICTGDDVSEDGVPDQCALNGAPYGALIGKVGASAPFVMGASFSTLDIPGGSVSGELFLRINDNEDFYDDNAGGFVVRLR